jgi:hypothetical protein
MSARWADRLEGVQPNPVKFEHFDAIDDPNPSKYQYLGMIQGFFETQPFKNYPEI